MSDVDNILVFFLRTFTVEHAMHQKNCVRKYVLLRTRTETIKTYWCLHCSAMGATKLSLVATSKQYGIAVLVVQLLR